MQTIPDGKQSPLGRGPAGGPKSVALYERARSALAGGVGHDLRHAKPHPLYIQRAKGSRKWDVDGNEYVDYLLGNGSLLLGHAHPEVIEAAKAAMEDGTHFGSDHPLHIEWAEQVQRMVPSAERVRFVNSGTEATLLAIRLARAFTGKTKLLRFEGHFHGWHDAVVHGYTPPFKAPTSLGVPAVVQEQTVCVSADLDLVEATLKGDREIAAAILEPSGASWGRVPLDAEFLRGLRELTARYGVLLIFDEVITGFRWHPGGVQGLTGVIPDLTTLAKVLTGGLPGGATVGRAEIIRLFDFTGDPAHDRYGRVIHFGTFNAVPPIAAAGVAALKIVETGEPIARVNRLAKMLREQLDGVLKRYNVAGYVYGEASVFHVYFETDPARIRGSREELKTTDAARIKSIPSAVISAYQRHLLCRGVDLMSYTGGCLSSAHTEEDLEWTVEAFEGTIQALLEEKLLLML